ncbi:MAG: hypothetical protein GY796_19340 [Chloroflexi bacterium]|nr:hypothetical protein [Chloroflexota bacterium]
MSTASEQTIQLLEEVVNEVPVGTNLGLIYLMWAMMSGAFLKSRGAIFTALLALSLTDQQIRRSWSALRYGVWNIDELIAKWNGLVVREGKWKTHSYEGYTPIAGDLIIFWRPRLLDWAGKFYCGLTGRTEKGVGYGVLVEVGEINGHRIPLLKKIIRAKDGEMDDKHLKERVLSYVSQHLGGNEVFVHDAGITIKDVQEAGVPLFTIRLACNCTARRSELPPRKKTGRPPEYGRIVRPVSRKRKGKKIPASKPDFKTSFERDGRTIHVKGWNNLVRTDQKVADTEESYSILVFDDPLYKKPLVLGYNFEAKPETVFLLYLDRWPVEQIALAAKQMMGMGRQFVFSTISVQRLPELSMLAGNILTYLAAVLPPLSTGFWDRKPKRTPGRLRRALSQESFPKEYVFIERIREKRSATDHLPKGIEGHRRVKKAKKVILT